MATVSTQNDLDLDLAALLNSDPSFNNEPEEIDLTSDLLSSLLNTHSFGLEADSDCQAFFRDEFDEFFDAQETLDPTESIQHDHQYTSRNTNTGVCDACRREQCERNEAGRCPECQLSEDIKNLYDDDDAGGLASSPELVQRDFGYESMAVSSSGSDSESLAGVSSEKSASVGDQSPLSVLAYIPIPRLSQPQSSKMESSDALKSIQFTEEEKQALKAEGLPIPTTWPLTKVEEKTMKAVRRKIRNKMCAAASRQRKKEYIDGLERRVQVCSEENENLQKKVDTLQYENRSLLAEMKRLKQRISNSVQAVASSRSAQSGTCLMVLFLCFALFFPQWAPFKLMQSSSQTPFDYTTPSVQSRSLQVASHYEEDPSFLWSVYHFVGSYFPWESGSHDADAAISVAQVNWISNSTDKTALENATLGENVA
eukprot:m.28789 g.28789  ORF g.28789 m.28789 type:complete len:426 (+) comp31027_c0_seq2:42-1319(+)